MKIGILVESFPKISQTWLDNQLIDLLTRGHDITIYSVYPNLDPIIHQQVKTYHLQEKTQYFYYPRAKSVRTFLGGLNYIFKYIGNTNFFKIFLAIKAVIEKKLEPLFAFNYVFLDNIENLDILHAHFGEMGVFAAKMKKVGMLRKTKIVVSFHGHDIFPFKKDFYKEEYMIFEKYANALLVNSEYSEFLLNEIISFKHVRILPVGLNIDYFKPDSNQSLGEKVRLVFLGRMVYLKGGLIMIEIFHRLIRRNPDLKLIMIGDGEKKEEIEVKVKTYGLENSVQIKGTLSQDQIIDEFKGASIYVYPGLLDPFFKGGDTQGLVVQEAQAMELPVVCSDVGGVKYGMIEGKTGFLVKEGDIDGFLEKIQFLIDHQEERIKMGKAGRSFVKEKFDSKVIGDQLEKVYYEVLQPN